MRHLVQYFFVLIIVLTLNGCHKMASISNLDEPACAENFQSRLKGILVRYGEEPDVAERLARSQISWLSLTSLGSRPFFVRSPSGADYTFFISRAKDFCKLHLVEKQHGFRSFSSNMPPYLASRKLKECFCSNTNQPQDEQGILKEVQELMNQKEDLKSNTKNEEVVDKTPQSFLVFKKYSSESQWGVYMNTGDTLYNQGNAEAAINMFNEAIKIDNEKLEAYYWRGNSYAVLNMFDMAILDYERILSRDGKNVLAINNRGYTYYMKGVNMEEDMHDFIQANEYFQKALADFNKAISLNHPNSMEVVHNRAATLRRLGKIEEACKEWHRPVQAGVREAKALHADFCNFKNTSPD
jgi:tetratricopeptide (TPR) repeat protein